MGPNTRVIVKNDWQEPSILWNVVLADKGEETSAALNRLLKPIQEIEEMQRAEKGKEQRWRDGSGRS
jgi:hypothetical protein